MLNASTSLNQPKHFGQVNMQKPVGIAAPYFIDQMAPYSISLRLTSIRMEFFTHGFFCTPYNEPSPKPLKPRTKTEKPVQAENKQKTDHTQKRTNILLKKRATDQIQFMHFGGTRFEVDSGFKTDGASQNDMRKYFLQYERKVHSRFTMQKQMDRDCMRAQKLGLGKLHAAQMKNAFWTIRHGIWAVGVSLRNMQVLNKLVRENVRVQLLIAKREKDLENLIAARKQHAEEVAFRRKVFTVHYKYWAQQYFVWGVSGW